MPEKMEYGGAIGEKLKSMPFQRSQIYTKSQDREAKP
jgi:hypothetical protein